MSILLSIEFGLSPLVSPMFLLFSFFSHNSHSGEGFLRVTLSSSLFRTQHHITVHEINSAWSFDAMMECNNNVSHSYYFYCICIIVVARVTIVSNREKSTTCYFHSTIFFQTIGRTFLPPYWSLGFQLSRWGYNKIETVKGLVANMSKHNLPQV